MPVIPGSPESQVLVPGSPVPVAAPEEQRLQGHAIAGVGEAMFALGEVAAKEKTRRDSATLELAKAEYDRRAQAARAEREAALPIEGDYMGLEQDKVFRSTMSEHLDDIAGQINDPETRRSFLGQANNAQNVFSQQLIAAEVKKQVDHTNNMTLAGVAQLGEDGRLEAVAYKDPVDKKMIDPVTGKQEFAVASMGSKALASAEKLISNVGLPPAKQAAAITDAKKRIVTDMINGATDTGKYELASMLVHTAALPYLDSEEKQKMIDHIQSAHNAANTAAYTDMTRSDHIAEKAARGAFGKELNALRIRTENAGNDQTKLDQIAPDAAKLIVKYGAQVQSAGAQVDALVKNTAFSAVADKQYEVRLFKQIADNKMSYTDAIDKVNKDIYEPDTTGKGVSAIYAGHIVERLRATTDRINKDPNYAKLVNAGEKLIADEARPSKLNVLGILDQENLQRKVDDARIMYFKMLGGPDGKDPAALAESVRKRVFGANARMSIRGADNAVMDYKTPEAVTQEMDNLKKKYAAEKVKGHGYMDPKAEEDFVHNLKAYEDIRADLIRQEELRKHQPQTNVPSAAAGGN